MKKRLLAILLCAISVFLCCGCGSINYVLQVDADAGTVTQGVVFEVSKQDIENSGKTITDFKTQVEYVANTVVQNSFNRFLNAHQSAETFTTYGGGTATYAQIVVYTQQNIDPFSRPKIVWAGDTNSATDTLECSISLKFLSTSAYLYFYDSFPDEEDENEKVIEEHWFYNKIMTEQNSPFSSLETNDIANHFLQYFGTSFGLEDMTYSFVYSTPEEKLYSDADEVSIASNGNHIHIWHWTSAELEADGGKIVTYNIKVKAYMWYILAIAISVFTAVSLWVFCKVKEKHQKNKALLQTQQNEPETPKE